MTLGGGELLSRLVGFGGTIYIARQLGVEMYGVIGVGFAVLLYATVAADCGLEYTGPREVVDAGPALPALVTSLLVARLAVAAMMSLLQVGVAAMLPQPERAVLMMYAIALLPVGLNLRWAHIGLERAAVVSAARLVSEGLKVGVIVAFVRTPSDVLLVPMAQIVGDAVGALLLLTGLRRRGLIMFGGVNVGLALGAIRRARPMLANAMLAMVIYNSDLIFIRVFRDAGEVGRYLAAYTLLNFLGILGHLMALSLTPALTRWRSMAAERSALLQRAVVAAFALGLPIAAGGTLTAPLIISFAFGPEYAGSATAFALLMWCFPILLYRSVLQAALVSAERSGDVLKTTGAAAFANVALNLVAVPAYGITGAAITTVLAEAVRAAAARGFARRAGFDPPSIARYARAAGSVAAMVAVLLLARPGSLWFAIPLAGATYAAGLAVTGAIRVRRTGVELSM